MKSKKHEHKGQGKRKTSVCKLLSHTIHHLSCNEWLLNEYWTWTNHHISVQSKKMTHRSPQTIFSFDLSLFANNRGSGKVSYTLFYTTIWKDFELSLTLLSIVFERKLWWGPISSCFNSIWGQSDCWDVSILSWAIPTEVE